MRAGAKRSAWRGLALVAALLALEARAESCLAGRAAPERARPEKTRYAFDRPGHGVDASGVVWRRAGHHAVRLRGKQPACFHGGTIVGDVAEDAVYECHAKHGYRGTAPCTGFHITAGMALEVDAPETVVEDVAISDYGDGVSLEAISGPVVVRRAYLHDLHDDAVENDFGGIVTVTDTLIERAYMAFASRPRSGRAIDQRGRVFSVRRSLVRLHRFTNAYKQKPGHGGLFKWPEDGSGPSVALTDNVFLARDPGRDQLLLPLANQVAECRNNTLLWSGTPHAYRKWLADGGGRSDGVRDNAARLAALAHCYRVVVKPGAMAEAAFLAEHWDPLVASWKARHTAGRAADRARSNRSPASP